MASPSDRVTLADHIITLMSDDGEWTLTALHASLGSTADQLRRVVRPLVESGIIRVCGTVEPRHEKKYQLAAEIDLDNHCRSQALWWPTADSTVANAISAMVRLSAAEIGETGDND
ncbi:hypothetical protein [Burkholderia cepacia]|uniref:hypothetical protein n=1 Tax=Burkholderia cepacia TaxID=292 RepID=UPI00158918B0|nr:hypothetical protein [Burkholderia cepacia]